MSLPVSQLLNLKGKVAIVTGASQGIGASIISRLAEAGAKTLVHFRNNESAAAEVLAQIQEAGGIAIGHRADVSQADEAAGLIAAAVKNFGGLDIIVNNAGIFPNKALLEMSHAEWSQMYSANMDTAFLCTKIAAEQMRKNSESRGGVIINIASTSASHPAGDHSHYNSSKAALLMFTRSAAKELGEYGIRVNAVSPGLTNRPGLDKQWPEGVNSWKKQAPLGRLGETQDIANACLFLASPAASYISGHNLIVDGGMMTANLY